MKTYLDCIPCFFKQALFACRVVTDDEKKIKLVLDRIGAFLPEIPLTSSPPETGREIYRIISEVTQVDDPFKEIKRESIRSALKLYPDLKRRVLNSRTPLEITLRFAIAGNVIDFGANPDFILGHAIEEIFKKDFAIYHFTEFERTLKNAQKILYLADNAGETVFDRILIEEISRPVIYAVRGKPVINDATVEDAIQSGLDEVATIISSGCDAPGTILARCTDDFLSHFYSADLIISKGQGNYETLSSEKRPIFYLLKAKCPLIAQDLKVRNGDIVLKDALYP